MKDIPLEFEQAMPDRYREYLEALRAAAQLRREALAEVATEAEAAARPAVLPVAA